MIRFPCVFYKGVWIKIHYDNLNIIRTPEELQIGNSWRAFKAFNESIWENEYWGQILSRLENPTPQYEFCLLWSPF